MSYPPSFQRAAEFTLEFEGGYVRHPNDPGGATNHGISLRFLRRLGHGLADIDGDGDVDADDVRLLDVEHALQLYYDRFWLAMDLDTLPERIAAKVFDIAVNMGPRAAVRTLQRGLKALQFTLEDDGLLGPITRRTTFEALAGRTHEPLLAAMRAEQAAAYRLLVRQNPDFADFLRGWLRRAYA